MMKEELYVTIQEPVRFRRELLYMVKESLALLKFYSTLSATREKKLELIRELSSILDDTRSKLDELASILPKTPKKVSVKKTKHKATKNVKVEIPRKKTELDLLEEELKKVEEELKNLA